jgi:hypothetical protein
MKTGMIDLQNLVTAIRDELERIDEGRLKAKKPALFHLADMELELNFTVVENVGAKGGIDLKVVSFGMEGSLKSEQVQKVRLKFKVPKEVQAANVVGARAHSTSASHKPEDIEPIAD